MEEARSLTDTVVSTPSPWLMPKRKWDDLKEYEIARTTNWRFTAWLALAGLLVSGVGNIAQAVRAHFQVWLVAVGPDHRVLSSGSAEVSSVIDDATKRAALGDWVSYLRGVTSDPIVQRHWIDKAYAMISTGTPAEAHISEWYRARPPGDRMQTETVEVQVETVLAVGGSYQVTWTEAHHSAKTGETTSKEEWKGMFLVAVDPPHRPEEAAINPLGLYVAQLSWSKVFNEGGK